ncbi:MAG TPA: response regulator [Rhodanobacter sp.]|nr:response regulator [Rhodanobacter sp.]
MSTDRAKPSAGPTATHPPGAGPACVLLVEDDAIVAMLVEQILLDMALQVLVVSTLAYALVEVEMASFDVAIIDMHLRGDHANQLVDALLLGKIPFMVFSGSDQSKFRTDHPHIPVLGKPFEQAELEQYVRRLLERCDPR